MDRRIFGLETEFGVNATFRSGGRLSPEEVARYLFRKVVAWGRSSNVFLANGSRLYLDVGLTRSTPPPSAPTCSTSSPTTGPVSWSSRTWPRTQRMRRRTMAGPHR